MTIHAAKGLEFESVFLVNMHQRCREDHSLPRIRELADGRIEVSALAPGDAEDDRLSNRVEEEEKRLLYVAMTRARRYLTLAAVLDERKVEPKSVLGLVPEGLKGAFREALEGTDSEVSWRGHRLRALRPVQGRRLHEEKPESGRHRMRLEPLTRDALEGRIVELPYAPDTSFEAMRLPELEGERHRGVAFSFGRGVELVRGTIDCLVVSSKTVAVVERYGEAGERRMPILLQAAAALFPGREVQGYLVHPDRPPTAWHRESGHGGDQLPLF
jgi:UvrD-like helicase C-terminal domain